MVSVGERIRRALRVKSLLLRAGFAEFLGTFILIVFGDGSVAQSVLSNSSAGGFLSINWTWGIAVCLGALCSVNVSGGHLNPAVSVTMMLIGRLSPLWCLFYCIAQYLGAFAGAAVVYAVYFDALNHFDGGVRLTDPANATATAGIFATYPKPFLSSGLGFVDQVVGTGMLLLCVMVITDARNAGMPKYLAPFFVGLSVFVIGTAYGFNCGYAINPARDLGPRILTALAGWGTAPFTFRDYNWFWVPIVGPHVGAVIGALIYLLLVEVHWPEHEALEKVEISTNNNKEGFDNIGADFSK